MATSDTKKIRANPLPSLERVRELFNYNPLTGILTWRICINPAAPLGAVAGYAAKAVELFGEFARAV